MPKAAKISLIVVIILGLLAFAADRVLAATAEGAIAKQVSQRLVAQGLKVTGEPDVAIEGFPFLTQVADGEFKAVRIDVADVQSASIFLAGLQIRAAGVTFDAAEILRGSGSVTAAKITGTGAVAYSSLASLLQLPDLTIVADNGKLKLRAPVQVAGQSFMVVASGTVSLNGGRVRLTVSDIRPDGGGLPPGAQRMLSALAGGLSQDLTLPALPYNLAIDRLEVANDGLRVYASATNVSLAG